MLAIVVAASIFVLVVYLGKNYFTVPSSIPGPFLAKFTDVWRAYKQYNGQLRHELIKLHAKHGAVVRYGIKSVSLADPKLIDVIYGSRVGYTIAHSYDVLLGISNGKEVASLISTRDEIRHGQLRKSVTSAFAPNRVQDSEIAVDAVTEDLMDALERNNNKEIDLARLMALFGLDSAYRMIFSDSLGCLQSESDVDNSIELIRDRFRHWGHWSSLPWLERLVFRNPWAMRQSVGKSPAKFVKTVVQKLQKRLGEKDLEEIDILNKFIQAHTANPDILDMPGVIGLIMSTLSGAGDTIATTVTVLLYHLMKSDPSRLQKLRNELREARIKDDAIPQYNITASLPYLAAVIKESMRVVPVLNWPSERLVPTGTVLSVNGMHIPAGTSVGIFTQSLHLSKEIYGGDADQFRPERWLEANEQTLRRMEQSFMGFSRGRRVCIGQNIALLQMKKLVPAIIMRYDLELVDEHATLDGDFSSTILSLNPLMVRVRSTKAS